VVEPKESRWQLRRYYERRPEQEPSAEEGGEQEPSSAPTPWPSPEERLAADVEPVQRGALIDDNIDQRQGNYLISFGFPGSGKTTFQSFLAYYVTHIGPFEAQPLIAPEQSVQGWEPMAIFNEWMRIWGQGRFPPANPVDEGDIRELSFRVRPLQGNGEPVDLSFLEASGELMTQVVADRVRDPAMIETLSRYFANEQLRLILVLVVDPEHGEENDILFQNLLAFLDLHFPALRGRTSLAVLVSKPEQALRRLQERDEHYRRYEELSADACEAFVQRFAPRTYRILDGWTDQDRVQLMALHLGTVTDGEHGPRLQEPDYDDIRDIFAWIYGQFGGGRMGPTWWQRILEWLRL